MSLQECAQHALNNNLKAISYSATERACYLLKNEKAGSSTSGYDIYRISGGQKTPTVAVCDDKHECAPPDKWDIRTGKSHDVDMPLFDMSPIEVVNHPPSLLNTLCVPDFNLWTCFVSNFLFFQAKATLEVGLGLHAAQMASSLGRWPMKITALTSSENVRCL